MNTFTPRSFKIEFTHNECCSLNFKTHFRLDQERNLSDATDSLSDLSVYAFSDASINDPFAVERIFYIEEQNLSPSDLLSTTEAASLAQNSLYGNTTETENSSDFERIHFPLHQPHSEVWIRKRIGISNYIMNYIRLDQLCEESLHTRISSYAKLDIALPSQVECQAGYVNDKIKVRLKKNLTLKTITIRIYGQYFFRVKKSRRFQAKQRYQCWIRMGY